MEQEEERVVVPMINVTHNESDSGLNLQVNLAGAPKKTVDLEMGREGKTSDTKRAICLRIG